MEIAFIGWVIFFLIVIIGIVISFYKIEKLKKINEDLSSKLSNKTYLYDRLKRDWETYKKKQEKICEELGILVERKKIKNVSGKKIFNILQKQLKSNSITECIMNIEEIEKKIDKNKKVLDMTNEIIKTLKLKWQ